MHRRSFIALSAAAAVLPAAARAEFVDYAPGLVEDRLAAGETVLLDFKADWCSTCRAQERALRALWDENPAYTQAITFVAVDWDDFRDAEITRALRIPRRSTLVLLRGDAELGRVVAQTRKADIAALLDLGLQAS